MSVELKTEIPTSAAFDVVSSTTSVSAATTTGTGGHGPNFSFEKMHAALQQSRQLAALSTRVNSQSVDELQDLEKSILSICATVERIRERVLAEKQQLKAAQETEKLLKKQHDRLRFMELNLPPALAASVQPDPSQQSQQAENDDIAADKENGNGRSGAHSNGTSSKRRRRRRVIPTIEPVTDDEFAGVPSYMRGRITCEKMNRAIEDIQNILKHKYNIMATPMMDMSESQVKQWKTYKSHETKELTKEIFFAETDIIKTKTLKQDNTGRSILTILRHLQRIRNARCADPKRFIIIK
jgi:spindle and kinetochore-associated protein 1